MLQIEIAIVILAAGASARLGRPKQLLRDAQGQTLLTRAIKAAQGTTAQKIYVVLGAHAADCQRELNDAGERLTIIENAGWQAGLSASIAAATRHLTDGEQRAPDAILFMLCDQPAVTTAHLQSLLDEFTKETAELVATRYRARVGVPALFGRRFYADLKTLHGDAGARELLQAHVSEVRQIELPTELRDIDTEADYADFLRAERGGAQSVND